MAPDRRRWMQQATAVAGGLGLTLGRLGHAWATPAPAASGGDYRALVCVVLAGGHDGNNLVVPLDEARHSLYRRPREAAAGLALPRQRLLPLDDGSQLGLHPALAPLLPLWQARQMALLLNVGLLEPPGRPGNAPGAPPPRPSQLYSHPDQFQALHTLWPHPNPSSGWAGRLLADQPLPDPAAGRWPALWSLAGATPLFQGKPTASLVLPARGPFGMIGFGSQSTENAPRLQAMRALWDLPGDALHRQVAQVQNAGLAAIPSINPVVQGQHTLSTPRSAQPFEGQNTDISQQLLRVAWLIEARQALGQTRSIFHVRLEGFDTHVNQAGEQQRLLTELAQALRAFHDAMAALGMAEQVTSITLSEFGRSLQANSRHGTDHGWGNHHWVLGGAVQGGRSYGRFPDLTLGGADDAERNGRWVPSMAWEQPLASLGRWLGLAPATLQQAFPRWSGWLAPPLDLMA